MKSKGNKNGKKSKLLREQILQSMLASFKIEGINIPANDAALTFKKVQLILGK